jgi:GNAT superfamily N-acetyltransferase
MDPGLIISRAAPDLAGALTRAAAASKSFWGYPQAWMDSWADLLRITPEYIQENVLFAAYQGGELAGFYALVQGGKDRGELTYILDHLWVLPEKIGTGIGRALFGHALEQAAALGASRVELEADPNAAGFYERMGARHIRDTVTPMERTLPVYSIEPGVDRNQVG